MLREPQPPQRPAHYQAYSPWFYTLVFVWSIVLVFPNTNLQTLRLPPKLIWASQVLQLTIKQRKTCQLCTYLCYELVFCNVTLNQVLCWPLDQVYHVCHFSGGLIRIIENDRSPCECCQGKGHGEVVFHKVSSCQNARNKILVSTFPYISEYRSKDRYIVYL